MALLHLVVFPHIDWFLKTLTLSQANLIVLLSASFICRNRIRANVPTDGKESFMMGQSGKAIRLIFFKLFNPSPHVMLPLVQALKPTAKCNKKRLGTKRVN